MEGADGEDEDEVSTLRYPMLAKCHCHSRFVDLFAYAFPLENGLENIIFQNDISYTVHPAKPRKSAKAELCWSIITLRHLCLPMVGCCALHQ